jgi:type I restriction enzyme, S subunit
MKIKFDVTPKEFIIIQDILKEYLNNNCKIWVFGSRAKSSSLFNSDLDLALEYKDKIDFKLLSKIKIAFEDSRLPYRVDVVDINSVKPYFKDLIKKEMILFPFEFTNNIPKLRFKEFSGDWEEKKLKSIISNFIVPMRDKPKDLTGNIPWCRIEDFNGKYLYSSKSRQGVSFDTINDMNLKVYPLNTLLVSCSADLGRCAIVKKELISNQTFIGLVPIDDYISVELLYYIMIMSSNKLNVLSSGTTISYLSRKEFENFKINLPQLKEQEKIASFLTSVDTKIEQLTSKENLLKEYKKGVMQKIFNQEIKFKSDDGSEFCEWENKIFGEVFKRITTKNKEDNKNVLTISAQQGLINQEKYFNKSVSAKDLTGYYLLENGDFAYNKSYSKGYPMGAIKKLNNYDKGVVSTLYICFRTNNENDSKFYEKYFDSGFLNRELHKIAQEGARNHGLLNMSVVEFFSDMKIPVPSIEEQTKIADFLSSIDKKIEFVSNQLEQTKEFKKGLLQQMFV